MADHFDDDLAANNRESQRGGGFNEGQASRADARQQRAEEDFRDAGDEEALARKLRRRGGDDLIGDMEENRNLSGSSTWQNLPDQADPHPQHTRKGQAESPNDLNHEEQPKQHKRGGRV